MPHSALFLATALAEGRATKRDHAGPPKPRIVEQPEMIVTEAGDQVFGSPEGDQLGGKLIVREEDNPLVVDDEAFEDSGKDCKAILVLSEDEEEPQHPCASAVHKYCVTSVEAPKSASDEQ